MSYSWLWLIVNLLFIFISINQARYLHLSVINCSESSPIGTPISQLLHVLPSSNWKFRFLTQTLIKSYFLLDDLKGTITVKRLLDREDLCRLNLCSCSNECLLKLEINAISDTNVYILSLPILIFDENDNNCYFSNDIYSFNISENVHLNTRIILPIAYDPDFPPNNIQSYFLGTNNYSEFRFDNQSRPSMIIREQLDRELCDRYYFQLCAYEGLNEQKRSCCTKIVLIITDVNDNSAKFQHDQRLPLVINVSESSLVNTEVIQMKAFDPDEGLNGDIRFTFSKWTLKDRTINEIFDLNPENGSIKLLKQLDYEKRNNYELQIQANDLGPNSIAAYATVIIQVIDENDCIPEIFIFSPPDVQLINNSIIYIFENVSLNTSILYLTVFDHDTGENGRVTIELLSSNSILRLQKINDNTYILLSDILFDREQISFYSFSLIIYDHGQLSQTVICKFDLHIIDINDNSPFFENSTNYSFYINENNKENLILHTIQTFDLDENDHLTLYLEYNNDEQKDLFRLNEQNQLVIIKSLDYEKQSSYQFNLIAEDAVRHRTSILIKIHINDLNDNPVEFSTNFTQFKIKENQPNGTFLGQIQAEDKDKNTQIIYTIHSDDLNSMNNFIEFNTNGSLYTRTIFDREQFDQIQFRVIANDSLHTDLISVKILILDINDNKPILKTPSPYCLILPNNESMKIQLEAYDPDGNVSFSIRNPSSSDLILLSNGTLMIKSILKKYSFDIYLNDNGKEESRSSIYENFILLIVQNQSECQYYSFIRLDQRLIFIGLTCLIIFICFCFPWQQQRRKKSLDTKTNLTPSFSSSLNDTLLLPSSQFTVMTTNQPTSKSSSLSSSSSSTYIKMSRSFEDEII